MVEFVCVRRDKTRQGSEREESRVCADDDVQVQGIRILGRVNVSVLSAFTPIHVIPDLYDFISAVEQKKIYILNTYSMNICPYNERLWRPPSVIQFQMNSSKCQEIKL